MLLFIEKWSDKLEPGEISGCSILLNQTRLKFTAVCSHSFPNWLFIKLKVFSCDITLKKWVWHQNPFLSLLGRHRTSFPAGYCTDRKTKSVHYISLLGCLLCPGFLFMLVYYYYRMLLLYQENNSEVQLHASEPLLISTEKIKSIWNR